MNTKYKALEEQLAWWTTRGDNALRYLAKAHQQIQDLEARHAAEHKELIALRMFYLSTKLAAQTSSQDQYGFNKAMQHLVNAEDKIIQIQTQQKVSPSQGISIQTL